MRNVELNSPHSNIEHDIDAEAVDRYFEEHEIDRERYEHWLQLTEQILAKFGNEFSKYTIEDEDVVELGEEILRANQGTGFNVDRFDIVSDSEIYSSNGETTVYYNCSIDRPEHFSLMLAEMEQLGIISEDQLTLGTKASEVSWEPDWSDTSPKVDRIFMERNDGSIVEIGKTVETVIRFSVDQETAYKILDYLYSHAYFEAEDALPGSWKTPDIRFTVHQETNVLRREANEQLPPRIVPVSMNEHPGKHGKLLVLRKKSHISDEGWNAKKIGVNKELAEFLSGFGVED